MTSEAHVRVFTVHDVAQGLDADTWVMGTRSTEPGVAPPSPPTVLVPLEDVVAAINVERRTVRTFKDSIDKYPKGATQRANMLAAFAQADYATTVLDTLEGVIRLHEPG